MATPYVFGAQHCAKCHSENQPEQGLCRMVESRIWEAGDPHKLALNWGRDHTGDFVSNSGRRAWEIGKRLGVSDVSTSGRCVGCHSISASRDTPKQLYDRVEAEGVTCVACHGGFDAWVTEHQAIKKESWRSLTRQAKWIEKGMVDLWDPVTRARTCVSCHMSGSHPSEGKSLSHQLFAAGHPPLGGIEVASFCEQLPKHWVDMHCKNVPSQREHGFNPNRMEHTELVIAGALVTLQQALLQYSTQTTKVDGEELPIDFAQYDCAGCHHELSTFEAARWPTPAGRSPGQPTLPRWAQVLVPAAIEACDPHQAQIRLHEYTILLESIARTASGTPFDVTPTSRAKAQALAEWLEHPIAALRARTVPHSNEEGKVIGREATLALLNRLAQLGSIESLDFDSARQVGWAFRSLWNEYLTWANSHLTEPSAEASIALAPRVAELMSTLDDCLALSLRSSKDEIDGCNDLSRIRLPKAAPELIGSRLEHRSRISAAVDPREIKQTFEELRKLLPAG
jgi:hypothetical protein